eukprot:4114441-Pyramimonas_sp.AAC.1
MYCMATGAADCTRNRVDIDCRRNSRKGRGVLFVSNVASEPKSEESKNSKPQDPTSQEERILISE